MAASITENILTEINNNSQENFIKNLSIRNSNFNIQSAKEKINKYHIKLIKLQYFENYFEKELQSIDRKMKIIDFK